MTTINDLPNEILLQILSYNISLLDAIYALQGEPPKKALVCQKWLSLWNEIWSRRSFDLEEEEEN